MKNSIKESDLRKLAESLGLEIQHDCGGYRVINPVQRYYVYPDSGICPTVTKRECRTFLLGVHYQQTRIPFSR